MNKIADAQTIAQAKHGQSLADFLLALPTTMEAQIFYALTLGCALGMIIHYVRQWASGNAEGGLLDYLFLAHPRRTVLTVIGVVSWSAGEVATGLFTTEAGDFVGWALVILSGLKTGYAGDSIINKGKPPPTAPVATIEPLPQPRAPGG